MALEQSPIRVLGYQILRSNYEVRDLANPGSGTDSVNFQFDASDFTEAGDGSSQMEAYLELHTTPSGENPSGYKLDFSARGMFSAVYLEEGGTPDDFAVFMKVNAFSLLYAFARSHIQTLTSMTPSGQVCLPCLDVNSIAETLSAPPCGEDEQSQ